MPDEKSPDTSPVSTKTFSRRDFLKFMLGGAAVVAGGGAIKKGVDFLSDAAREAQAGVNWETDSYSKIDFVNHPEWLVDNPRLTGRIKKDMLDLSLVTDSFLKRETVFEGMEEKGINSAKWQGKAVSLVENTVKWGGNLVQARDSKFTNAGYEVENKFFEQATYLQMVLRVYETHKGDPPDTLDKYLRSIPFSENVNSVVTPPNSLLNEPISGVKRSSINTVWAYDWKALVHGQEVISPTVEHYFDWEGNVLDWIPNTNAQFYFPEQKSTFEKDPRTLGLHPKEATVINFDPQVQIEVEQVLRKAGIDRGVKSVNWFVASFPQGNTDPSGNSSIGGPENLDIDKYYKYKVIYDQIIIHEGFHSLVERAGNLQDNDRIEFRDLWLKVVNKFDPLSDMGKLFAPDTSTINPDPANYASLMDLILAGHKDLNYDLLTDYYFMCLEGFESGDNPKNYRDELRNALIQLADVDIFKYFWPQNGDATVDDIFSRLEKAVPEMDVFSKFLTNTMLQSKGAIGSKKRHAFQDQPNDAYYFIDKVIPYTLAHIAMYKKSELMANLPVGKNSELVKHYIQSWQKRFDRFVRGISTEELTAELFSYAQVDAEEKIDWGDSKQDFNKMLEILKRNGLAFQPTSQKTT